jgi:hypothetical protein
MYIDILNREKEKLENDKIKAEKCKEILKSLSVDTRDVDNYLECNREEIDDFDCKISCFNGSEKRTDEVVIYVYANDTFGSLEGKDLEQLSDVIHKFTLTPHLAYCYSRYSPYRRLCFVSDKPLSKYEVEVIDQYMRYSKYFKAPIIDGAFKWDGNTLTVMSEPKNEED